MAEAEAEAEEALVERGRAWPGARGGEAEEEAAEVLEAMVRAEATDEEDEEAVEGDEAGVPLAESKCAGPMLTAAGRPMLT